MRELSRIATNLMTATSLTAAVETLERDLCRLMQLSDARCLWIDWAHRTVWSTHGLATDETRELISEVAGTGRRELANHTLLQPVGARPARAVFALRRSSAFELTELTMISTLAFGLAPALDRLIAGSFTRPSR